MTATATPTDKEADRREAQATANSIPSTTSSESWSCAVPAGSTVGASKRWSWSEPWSDGRRVEKRLRHDLKKMDAPPLADHDVSGQAARPKNMFDVLKPTDIVVMGSEPASVRVLDKDGKPVHPHG